MDDKELKDFEAFWESYPKKRSKGDAFKAWGQTKDKRPPLNQLLKALTVMKASHDWTKDGGQYIPYAATWLRAWGWSDVPDVELENVHNGTMWWETVSGTEAKARELGFGEWNPRIDSTWQKYVERLKKHAGVNVVPLQRTA